VLELELRTDRAQETTPGHAAHQRTRHDLGTVRSPDTGHILCNCTPDTDQAHFFLMQGCEQDGIPGHRDSFDAAQLSFELRYSNPKKGTVKSKPALELFYGPERADVSFVSPIVI